MALDLKHAFESGEFADLIISAGGEEFKVHKIVVCRFGPIKELEATARDGRIEIPETAKVIEAVFRGLYGFEYEVSAERDVDWAYAELQNLVDAFIVAEKVSSNHRFICEYPLTPHLSTRCANSQTRSLTRSRQPSDSSPISPLSSDSLEACAVTISAAASSKQRSTAPSARSGPCWMREY